MKPATDAIVQVENVEKTFNSGVNAIHVMKNVSLAAYPGEILMLVGPSGCGKTTLLSAIAGTLKVESGSIIVFGQPLHSMSGSALTRFRAKNIGFIFQQFNLIPTLSIAENVSVPLLIQGQSNRHAIKAAREALDAVGLADRWRERPNKLSGGQQQRVAIARALVTDPALIVADEPTGNLDAKSASDVLHILQSLSQSAGKTVIMVTHDPKAAGFGTRSLHLEKGEIVA
jgi:putative ABC transport system ATP-binding protein